MAAPKHHTREIEVRNPRTGEVDYRFEPPTGEQLGRVCAELRHGQRQWEAAGVERRVEVLLRWADVLEVHQEELVAADLVDAGGAAIARHGTAVVIAQLRGWSGLAPEVLAGALASGRSRSMPSVELGAQLRPYPLLGVISPWNNPLQLSLVDAIPALLAGCAAIVKPSEIAPRFVDPLRATIAAVPELAKVLTYVQGDGETGRELIANVDAVCFTGSVPTGRKVAEACAARFIPSFLELGGKDPAIVTASADLDRAAAAVVRGSVFSTGQICFATERVYVQAAVHDDFVGRLVAEAERVGLAYPDPESGPLGPFILAGQADLVRRQIEDALARGATLRTGGEVERLGGGVYMRPTVMTGVSQEMALMREETFGPVMPVMAYGEEEEAVTLANDTEYGLAASVLAGSAAEARRIGARLEAGTVSLQDTFLTPAKGRDLDTDSFKLSGAGGSRSGPSAILRFVRRQGFLTNTAAPASLVPPRATA